jgi:hypothetical protein
LKFAHSSLWRALFGRQAKDLEQSNTVSIFPFLSSTFCLFTGGEREQREKKIDGEAREKEALGFFLSLEKKKKKKS